MLVAHVYLRTLWSLYLEVLFQTDDEESTEPLVTSWSWWRCTQRSKVRGAAPAPLSFSIFVAVTGPRQPSAAPSVSVPLMRLGLRGAALLRTGRRCCC